ncbi:ferritin-like domain-containing protein [Myxococcota bacterium]|nr:ferritin-like domain-containing protein [Myxococcota bacterium]
MTAMLDLRDEGRRRSASITGHFGALSARERTLVESTWRGRMVNEHISAQVYAGLLQQGMRAGIPPAFLDELAAMIAEELTHAKLCAAVLHHLGGDPIAPLPELAALPEHRDTTPLAALLRNVLSVSCLSETVAVALIQAERLDLGDSPAASVLGEILGDEVGHASFGWRLFAALGPLEPHVQGALAAYLPTALTHLVAHELAHLSPAPAPTAAAAYAGACDGENARLVLFSTIDEVIVPGLERHGLPAARAWAELRATGPSG